MRVIADKTRAKNGFLYPPTKAPMFGKGVDTWELPNTEDVLKDIEPLVTLRLELGSNPIKVNIKLINPASLASISTWAPEAPVSSIWNRRKTKIEPPMFISTVRGVSIYTFHFDWSMLWLVFGLTLDLYCAIDNQWIFYLPNIR